jgi:hypothetical protein
VRWPGVGAGMIAAGAPLFDGLRALVQGAIDATPSTRA